MTTFALDTRPCTEPPLVLVSWDGQSSPLSMIHIDSAPRFAFLLFDYSGRCTDRSVLVQGHACQVLSIKTECKGDIYQALTAYLRDRPVWPEYVGLIDDDIMLAVSDINQLLHTGRICRLDSFSPVLSHDCHWGHRWTLRQGDALLLPVAWVEVMMPFYRTPLFMAGAPLYEGMVSSYGIDKFALPTVQKLTGCEQVALVNTVMASHMRPITSGGNRTYRNGFTGDQEKEQLRQRCMALVRQQCPALEGTAWWRRTFEQRHVRRLKERIMAGLGRPLRRWLERST